MDTHQIPSCYDPEKGVLLESQSFRGESTQQAVVHPDWAENALSELSQWLTTSQDRNKTLHLWSEAFIRCGSCKRAWDAWVSEHPISEPIESWVESATQEIRKNGWV